mgnify:FL=1
MQTNTVIQQINMVLEQYPQLQAVHHDGDTCIEGEFLLDVEVMGVPLYETYTIRIIIPPDYPKVMPKLVELSNKIPTTFEHKYADQYCCLGVPGNLAFEFYKDPNLLHYVQDMVTNYFHLSNGMKYMRIVLLARDRMVQKVYLSFTGSIGMLKMML